MSLVDAPVKLRFREVGPTDLPTCIALEQASYPEDEAASKSTLQYRQHQAATFFRCAVLEGGDDDDDDDASTVIGFVCSTRCTSFTHESMTTHVAAGPLLAIHSVVVREDLRRQGVASRMLQEYIQHILDFNLQCQKQKNNVSSSSGKKSGKNSVADPVEKIVLLAKSHLLPFYVKSGFQVIRPSPIVHGSELWYELEQEVFVPYYNVPCWVVDAFADPQKRGTGNPAAVVLMPEDTNADDETTRRWMQTTAQEFNLAETAFVWKKEQPEEANEAEGSAKDNASKKRTKECHYNIRYYTPTVEVPLCGHATLASASVLFQHVLGPSATPSGSTDDNSGSSIVFHALEDVLGAAMAPTVPQTQQQQIQQEQQQVSVTTRIRLSSGQCRIAMTFPSKPAKEIQSEKEKKEIWMMIKEAFQITEQEDHPVLWTGLSEVGDLLIELTTECFESLGYDGLRLDALMKSDLYTRGVILCCRPKKEENSSLNNSARSSSDASTSAVSDNGKQEEVDFCSRFFGPKAGIPEDPVTGSAHCVLAPYFSSSCASIGDDNQPITIIGHQRSRRGGVVECTMLPPDPKDGVRRKVQITGLAVTTMAGKLK